MRESNAGVIIEGRFIGGIGEGDCEFDELVSWSSSRSELGPLSRMTYPEIYI
jgi:hypothetical protein